MEGGVWRKEKLRSKEARSWVTAAVAHRGREFENDIGEIIEAGGWRIFRSIPMRQIGGQKALGEVDILAVREDFGIWVLIECKWFGAVRTAREVMNWMQDFHGKGGDKLDHHLQRFAWLRNNQELVARKLGIAAPDVLHGRIVTTRPVPLAFTRDLPEEATVLTQRQLLKALNVIVPGATPEFDSRNQNAD